jgi:hypothetical protein
MRDTACTEPQCRYRVHFTFFYVSIRTTNQWLLCGEIIAVYCYSYMENSVINLCERHTAYLAANAGNTGL